MLQTQHTLQQRALRKKGKKEKKGKIWGKNGKKPNVFGVGLKTRAFSKELLMPLMPMVLELFSKAVGQVQAPVCEKTSVLRAGR